MPNIGYGSSTETKHALPRGFGKFPVHTVKELEVLLMCNTCYCAETAHMSPQRTAKPLWGGQPAGHQVTNPNASEGDE
ncbi:60S ribosomal protein L32 [Myotis davidii]|uniref:60S ribosomal protein L32 n=1 Tax=Myotis davidii TaxID=225400 RepID=L5LVK6_MYODS|nr:60S ribosomal protein L32 [Myotis davidii]